MILQALVNYYEALAAQGKAAKPGWVQAKISHALHIDEQGALLGIIPLTIAEQRGKKTVEIPQNILLPEGPKRSSGVAAQFLWDNSKYILGVDKGEDQARSKKCFAATAAKCQQVLQNADGQAAVALKSFFAKWQPDKAAENQVLQPYWDELIGSANLTFYFQNDYISADEEIKQAWDTYNSQKSTDALSYCLVTGKKGPVARLHPSIKGVSGAKSSGASLVAFNAKAFESYGHEQGMNAPVSEYAAFAYTTALNTLLADAAHCRQVGEVTVVFWAEDGDETCAEALSSVLFDDDNDNKKISDADLQALFKDVSLGKPFTFHDALINPSNRFYILGIAPNAARLSIRFFLVSTFGKFMTNLQDYYETLRIVQPAYVEKEKLPLWMLLRETVNKNAKDKSAPAALISAMFRSMLVKDRYPEALYQNIILRAKADQDNADKRISKINYIKAAVIKAYLLRNKQNKEVTTVALNEESRDTAYVLGRLFAVLEHLQEHVNPNLNSTIKDRYFNSACASPNIIFPVLLKLSNHHLRKITGDKGASIFFEKQIGELMSKLDMNSQPLPVHLNLDEQGKFILGYYHQVQKRYTKKEDK